MTRLKLPAYGKKILLERRAGKHPLTITLVFGDRWWEVEVANRICLKPADYAPGKYDFRMVAGCNVEVHDLDYLAFAPGVAERPPKFGPFYDLLTELAQCGACIDIRWIGVRARDADELACSYRYCERGALQMRWPRWWSDALHAKHQTARENWLADQRCTLERERGRAA